MPQKAEGTPARTSRVYRFRDLKGAGVSYTRKHITDLEKRGEFPMHFQLGPNSIGWVAEEVALQQMRQVDRSVWAAGEHRPADRDREVRKQPNE